MPFSPISKRVVRIGAIAPTALVIPVCGDGSFDFTSVESADIFVRRTDGEEFQIVGVSISSQLVTGLTLTHVWQAGEVDQVGKWSVYARLYVSGGQLDTEPESFEVLSHFDPMTRCAP